MDGRVLFDLGQFSKMQIFLPVIRQLESQYNIGSVMMSSGEINPGLPTNMRDLRKWNLECIQVAPVRISTSFRNVDWYLYMMWLKRSAARLLQQYKTSVLVTPNDRTCPNHFYIDSARALGIPTLLIQEALRKDDVAPLNFRDTIRRRVDHAVFGISSRLRKYGQGGCTKVTAWGEDSRAYYLRVGVAHDKIAITGNPAFDEISNYDWRPDSQIVAERIGLHARDTVIGLFSSRLSKQGVISEGDFTSRLRLLLRQFGEFVRQHESAALKLVVKVKGDNVAEETFYYRLIQEEGAQNFTKVVRDVSLYPFLYRSAGVLIFSSTVGLEAALFGRPVGILDVGKQLDSWDFVGKGLAMHIGSQEEFSTYIKSVMAIDKRDEFGGRCRLNAEKYVAYLGTATDKVAQVIADLYEHASN